ncbi:MAG: hypothetical protein QW341_05950 [Candidatus Bathyarchaeia archaeon]
MDNLDIKVLKVKITAASTDFIYNYSGKIVKTILLTEVPELQPAFRPVKGFFKLIRVSPLIRGETAVTPVFERKRTSIGVSYELKPIQLSGSYMFEVGSTSDIISKALNSLRQVQGVKTRLKFENAIIEYVIEDIEVEDFNISLDNHVRIATVSPALLPTPYSATQHVRRFTISPVVVFWIPYLISQGIYSVTNDAVNKAMRLLETCLVEHYSSQIRVIHIPYDGRREPTLHFKAKYIVLSSDHEEKKALARILKAARVLGIGASRTNGFGTIQFP